MAKLVLSCLLVLATFSAHPAFAQSSQQTSGGAIRNFSLLVDLPPGGSSPPLGFVVSEPNTTFLVRAIGPSLAAFGVSHPAAHPEIRFYDSSGRNFNFLNVQTDGYPSLLPGFVAAYGAFPSTSPFDWYVIATLPVGAYTMKVTDQQGGTALIEIYQGPAPAGAIVNQMIYPTF